MDLNQSLYKNFLLIDDFSNVRKSVRGMLSSLGVKNITEAGNGVEATRQVRENRFDVIMCDYNLGKGKNGSQLLEEWRTKGWLSHETIFVMITAETSRDFVMGALEFQPDDYLAKPFSMDTLQQRLDRWLDRQTALVDVNVALDNEDWPGLARSARTVMETKPRYRGWAQRQYYDALYNQNLLTEAQSFLEGILEKRDQPWARLELYRIQVQKGQLDTAERGLKTLVMLQPNMVEAYDLLAQVQRRLKQSESAQETLSQALARSPRNIPRQRTFADLAIDNGDYYAATRAYKEVVNLAEGTMHESSDTYKDVLRATRGQLQSLDDEALRRRLYKEAGSFLKRLAKAYPDDTDTELFTQAYRVFLADPNDKAAQTQEFLDQLAESASKHLDLLSEDSAMDIAETLYEQGRSDAADGLVDKLRHFHHDSEAFVKRLNQLQSEPVTREARQQAHVLNTQGIENYKKKNYPEAAQQFEEAMKFSPRHPGIILNYIQSTLLAAGKGEQTEQRLDRCLDAVNRLHYLPEDHYQYERYQAIRKKVIELHDKVKT